MVFLGQWLACPAIFMLFMSDGLIIKVDKALSMRKVADRTTNRTEYKLYPKFIQLSRSPRLCIVSLCKYYGLCCDWLRDPMTENRSQQLHFPNDYWFCCAPLLDI